ncbi:Supervillin [Thelohanellus kitauei]|uniref:Supervillin n=1 Tax=Thelohanellus kitauei TaxID=669202 RepID=A0A0C2MNB5_THEKT|nr:Supervillin [Thelohanellus kitauei]
MTTKMFYMVRNVINRGKGGIDPDEGFAFSVQTQKLTVFKLENSEFVKTDEDVMSFFFSQQVYLVEWYFIYQRSDIKSLTGEDVDLEGTGRQVCVYFYWQGRDCTVSEKALSAILTIFYVNKKASQVHVGQDSEMPAFVSLFKTHYVSGIGHSDEFNANDHHLYLIRGTNLEECTLLEVEPHFTSLRSQGNFLYVHPASNTIYQWIGRLYNKALDITELLETLHKLFQVQTIEEGEEPEDFLTFLQFPAGKPYSFIASSIQFCCSFRKLDQYKIECNKISCQLSQIKDHNGKPVQYDNFSVHQNDLYSLIQPVLVLVCTTQNTYLWHGWVPPKGNSNNSEQLNDLNILTDKNFLEMKRYILEDLATFLKGSNYKKTETTFSEFITQIHAGLEPSDFIQLFPNWKKREDIYLQQLKLGRIADEQPSVSAQQTLSEQIFYPIEVLVKRPLPENVEPGKLENYIEDGEFEVTKWLTKNLFDMKKEEFSKLPRWKQNELKKSKQLF